MKPSEFFRKMKKDLSGLERHIADTIIKVEAEGFHAENFRKGGFTDRTFKKWPPRKDGDTTRALLVKSGTMRRHATSGKTKGNTIDFVMPLEYEKVHNEGGKAGRGQGFQMPQRQYIGESEELKKRIKLKAEQFLKRKFK